MNYLDEVKQKREKTSAQAQMTGSREALLGKLSDIERAALSRSGKGMSARREKLLEGLNELLENDDTKLTIQNHAELLEAITGLKAIIVAASNASESQTTEVISNIENMIESISEAHTQAIGQMDSTLQDIARYLKNPPKLPTPSVTVQERELDLKPLEKAIKALSSKKTLDLNSYRAQDLDTAPDGTQYVGFQDGAGSWYIMHSDDNTNTLRYFFGKMSYAEAWDERYSHDYATLSEAMK